MIQDMHNPEFYFETFEVYNTATNEIKNKTGKYKDTANIMVSLHLTYPLAVALDSARVEVIKKTGLFFYT